MSHVEFAVSTPRHSSPGVAVADDGASVLERIRRGDERACDVLVRRHQPRMLAVARRILGSEAEADDAVQDAFLSAFQKIHDFDGRSALGTWLYRIAVNAALMRRRSRQSRGCVVMSDVSEFDHSADTLPSKLSPSTNPLERDELRGKVRELVAQLPADYRDVLVMRDLEERDTSETAIALRASVGTIKTRLCRARRALRCLLETDHTIVSEYAVRLPA